MARQLRRSYLLSGLLTLSSLLAARASAQTPPPAVTPPTVTSPTVTPPTATSPTATPPAAAANNPKAEAEARAHFKRGNEHFDRQEWLEALDEFRRALTFKRTRALVVDEASCLKQLGRYDEALDAYEALRKEFPVLPASLESKVAPAIDELRRLVGMMTVAGTVPNGASLFVDDRRRGTVPLAAPLRLSIGVHTVRVEKEGFDPISARVVVKPAEESVATLEAPSKQGRLRVSEKHNWVLDVEVDGRVVGKTPWEGLVAPGDHQVRVHGFVHIDDDEEGAQEGAIAKEAAAVDRTEMGSTASTASVLFYEVTPVVLAARDLDTSLRVDATPLDAALAIDGKVVAHGRWEGRLPLGVHTLEISANGFHPSKQDVRLERRKQPELHVDLGRIPKLGEWGPKRTAAVGVSYGLGAVGLTVGVATGAVALSTITQVRSQCQYPLCPVSQSPSADKAATLATVSTATLIAGGAGMMAGTAFMLWYRPNERPVGDRGPRSDSSPVALSARFGVGSMQLEGRF